MTTTLNKAQAQQINCWVVSSNLNLSGLSRVEFINGVCANFGCSKRTATYAAKLTGNY